MNAFNINETGISKKLSIAVLLLLLKAQAVCITEGHQDNSNTNNERRLTTKFPHVPSLHYQDHFALAGNLLARNGKSPKNGGMLNIKQQLNLNLFQRIENFLSLLSPRHSSHGKNNDSTLSVDNTAIREGVMLDYMLASLDSLADTGAASDRCVNDTGYLIVNMFQRQGWALKFLDATGKPGPGLSEFRVNFVGDYDLCRGLHSKGAELFSGDYFTWKIAVGPINLDSPSPPPMIQWGVCLPNTCTETEITAFAAEAVKMLGQNGTLTVLQAEERAKHTQVTTATVAAIVIACIIGALMVLGTFHDIVFMQWPRWEAIREAREEEKILNGRISAADDDEPLILNKNIQAPSSPQQGKLAKALLAFSVYTNGSKLLNTTQQPGSITCLHGIRFLSMAWVILGHVFLFSLQYVDNLLTQLQYFLSEWSFDAVANALPCVDTFFTLSGFLVSYLTVIEMKQKRQTWRLNWGMFYFHRFWRLTPPYMLALVLVLGLHQFCGQGPLWETVQPSDKVFCEKNWWTNLLYVNNLVHTKEPCFAHTWYLANDMQFFVVAPLMIIPFFFSSTLGLTSCFLFFATHVITTGVMSTKHGWSATLISATNANGFSSYFRDYYITPWCRIGPYIVGILSGYLLATKRDKIKLNWCTATLGWLASIAVALAIVYGLRGDIGGEHPITGGTAALYNALSRSAWGLCVSWVIVACVTGWGGFINSFLSWSPFVVLGRLTYMAYLIHITLINIYYGNQQTLVHLTALNFAAFYVCIIVATYAIAFVLVLALESPMVGLEKVFLPQRKAD